MMGFCTWKTYKKLAFFM